MEKEFSFPISSNPKEIPQLSTIKIINIKSNDKFESLIPDNSINIETGDIINLNETGSNFLHSYGAGPCISGLIQDTDGRFKSFHFTIGDNFLPQHLDFFKTAQSGVIGGNQKTLHKFKDFFEEKNIKQLGCTKPNSDFHFLLDQSNAEIKFYYNYCQVKLSSLRGEPSKIPFSQAEIKSILLNTDQF